MLETVEGDSTVDPILSIGEAPLNIIVNGVVFHGESYLLSDDGEFIRWRMRAFHEEGTIVIRVLG